MITISLKFERAFSFSPPPSFSFFSRSNSNFLPLSPLPPSPLPPSGDAERERESEREKDKTNPTEQSSLKQSILTSNVYSPNQNQTRSLIICLLILNYVYCIYLSSNLNFRSYSLYLTLINNKWLCLVGLSRTTGEGDKKGRRKNRCSLEKRGIQHVLLCYDGRVLLSAENHIAKQMRRRLLKQIQIYFITFKSTFFAVQYV